MTNYDMPLLAVDNVFKSFSGEDGDLNVLVDISLRVDEGEIVCVLGPSGCGKTTLLNIIAGVDTASQGTVVIDGTSRVGYIPQRDLLLPWRTVHQNIVLGLEISGDIDPHHLSIIRDLTEEYGMKAFLTAYPIVLSGGMRQIASFIRTLVVEPILFLFDEPFASIDYELRLRLENKVVQMIRQTAKGALFITHSIDEAIAIGNRIIVLSRRPAHTLTEIEVKTASRWRSATEARQSPEFPEYFAQISHLLNNE
jgi:NitT/TauT family transport system ATP-binding protein